VSDEKKSTLGDLWDSLTGKAKAELAKKVVESAANSVLDDLEKALLGKEGAADEILARDASQGDALDRIRREALAERAPGKPPVEPPRPAAPTAADREAKARAELEELKKKLKKT
jgi:hypothetical protein